MAMPSWQLSEQPREDAKNVCIPNMQAKDILQFNLLSTSIELLD